MLVAPCSLTAARNVTSTSPTDVALPALAVDMYLDCVEHVRSQQSSHLWPQESSAIRTRLQLSWPFCNPTTLRLGFIDQGTYCLAPQAFHQPTIGQHRNRWIDLCRWSARGNAMPSEVNREEASNKGTDCKRNLNFKGHHHREVAWKVGHAKQQQKASKSRGRAWPGTLQPLSAHATSGLSDLQLAV
ncbi:hypothetical protein NCU02377 [Neurospora crassa OR74A]|uniref:Uncharacterized protein n=1 Tax=Neurospora crassa (strain ATCC 24698 / 74-OR23-1A / CBS 708.71 / DSM 1257 / FGSC 987) TaxID=367110 RepID=Q7S4V0_NEUCR|nr:hypothetical protein NCU02377 [Neurospora crassa OR74A]EAA30562.2 hypothetical protein NCU02377 [Neurospora crassa OR74A]|eukprot:XP_959798.2 hypothetical protein NCU02377 [Neurospora crassa OR74A]